MNYRNLHEIIVGQLQGDAVRHSFEQANAHDGGGLHERELVGALGLQMVEQLVQRVLLEGTTRSHVRLLHRAERRARHGGDGRTRR